MPDLSQMPKAELHLHLEGAFQWTTVRKVFERHYGYKLPEHPEWHHRGFRFREFSQFLQLFRDYIDPWLAQPSGYRELFQDVVAGLRLQNIRYAEIDFSIALIERSGHRLDETLALFEAEVEQARQQGIEICLFAGINRHLGPEAALHWVKRIRSAAIVSGIDLHGDEVGWSAQLFESAFKAARESGKHIKAHAGEMSGPESVREAVEGLNVTQIGHGTSSIKDQELMAMLRDRRVILEMCPTSNERMGLIPYNAHPLLELDRAGILVTINSDDSAFFGVNLTQEMARLLAERQVTLGQIKRWTANAFAQAKVDGILRQRWLEELEGWRPGV